MQIFSPRLPGYFCSNASSLPTLSPILPTTSVSLSADVLLFTQRLVPSCFLLLLQWLECVGVHSSIHFLSCTLQTVVCMLCSAYCLAPTWIFHCLQAQTALYRSSSWMNWVGWSNGEDKLKKEPSSLLHLQLTQGATSHLMTPYSVTLCIKWEPWPLFSATVSLCLLEFLCWVNVFVKMLRFPLETSH